MAYLQNGVSNTVISDARSGNFANVTIQNSGSLVVDFAHTFQGTIAGYNIGGFLPSLPGTTDRIEKFPFATDTNATQTGNLSLRRSYAAGASSDTSAYAAGGFPALTNIEKFAFALDNNGAKTGDLTVNSGNMGSTGNSSKTHGYQASGAPLSPAPVINTIQKWPFAADENSTVVGALTVARRVVGQSSETDGYSSGGAVGAYYNVVDKFPFATDGNATDVGDLTQARGYGVAGQSSTASGYSTGGFVPPHSNVIDKFPFASDANATDVGDLTVRTAGATGQQD